MRKATTEMCKSKSFFPTNDFGVDFTFWSLIFFNLLDKSTVMQFYKCSN